ncbi:hypothetical protein AB0B10_32370 [Micromonospora arborensis]
MPCLAGGCSCLVALFASQLAADGELYSHHPVSGLRKAREQGGTEEPLKETAEVLYRMALLAEGGGAGQPVPNHPHPCRSAGADAVGPAP